MRTLSLLERVDVSKAAVLSLWPQAHRRWWRRRWVAVYDAAYCFDASLLMMVIAMIVMLVLVLVHEAGWI